MYIYHDYVQDVSGSSRRKRGRPRKRDQISYKEEAPSDEELRPRRARAEGRGEGRVLVPPPLKVCVECGLKSNSHQENIDHWMKVGTLGFFNISENILPTLFSVTNLYTNYFCSMFLTHVPYPYS